MARFILTKEQVSEIVYENRFKLEKNFSSFNFDTKNLLTKTAESFGFEVIANKVQKVIDEFGKNSEVSTEVDKKYEGAVLQVRGNYSVKQEFSVKIEGHFVKGEFFIYHETQNNKLLKELAERLFQESAVKLFPGCETEYLYDSLVEVNEIDFYETIKQVAPSLPIYQLIFDEEGSFKVKVLGDV